MSAANEVMLERSLDNNNMLGEECSIHIRGEWNK